jgi:photosystem II stability/assembly factor-like uncharacterized protein
MFLKRGQTAVEYLILTSIVLVIALIALYSFDAIPSIGSGVYTAQNAKARLLPVGILEVIPQGNYTVFLVQNTLADTAVSVESIANQVGDCVVLPNQPRILAIGQKRLIHAVCENHSKYYVNTTKQSSFEETITISYMNLKTSAVYNQSIPYVIRQRIGELPVTTINPTHLGYLHWVDIHLSSDGVYQLANADCCGAWFSNNSGINWYNIATFDLTNQYFYGALNSDASVILLQKSTRVYMSKTKGKNWTFSDVLPTSISDLSTNSLGTIIAVATSGGFIYIGNSSALNFTPRATQEQWQGIAISQSGQYMTAISWGGKISVSTDFGVTWTQKHTNATRRDVVISESGQYQLTGGDSGNISVSTDYGTTWTDIPQLKNYIGFAMSSDGSSMYASASDDYIYKSTNYGASWSIISPVMRWRGIDVSSDGQIITTQAIDYSIVQSYDGGATWFTYDKSRNFHRVEMSLSGQYQTAVDRRGYIYSSQDYGQTWTKSAVVSEWYNVQLSDTGQYQFAHKAFLGYPYKSIDYGSTWLPISTPGTWSNDLCISPNASLFIYADDPGRIHRSTDSGDTLTNVANLSYQLGSCDISVNNSFILSNFDNSGNRGVYISQDGGFTWTNQTHSIGGYYGFQPKMSHSGQYILIPNRGGYLYRSQDYGQTWANITSLPNCWWQSVDISSSGQYQVASGYNGCTMYFSTNYGVNWTTIPLSAYKTEWTSISVSDDGQYITVVAKGGLIHVSSNAGANFTTITSYS